MRDGNESPVRRAFHGYEGRLEWHAYRRPGNALLCACLEGERAEMGQKCPCIKSFAFIFLLPSKSWETIDLELQFAPRRVRAR